MEVGLWLIINNNIRLRSNQKRLMILLDAFQTAIGACRLVLCFFGWDKVFLGMQTQL